MKRVRLLAIWSALGFALLVLFALVAQRMLSGEALTEYARQSVLAATGRALETENLRLHLFPVPALKADRLTLTNTDWASRPQLLEADELVARLDWLPLLSRKLVVNGLSAKMLRLNLETNAEGRHGWQLASGGPGQVDFSELQSLDVDSLNVWRKNGAEEGRQWNIRTLKASTAPGWKNVEVSGVLLSNGVRLQSTLELADLSAVGTTEGSTKGQVRLQTHKATLHLRGQFPLDPDLSRYDLQLSVKAESLAEIEKLAGWSNRLPVAPLDLQARLVRNGKAHEAKDLILMLGGQTIKADATLLMRDQRHLLQARVDSERLEWGRMMRDLGRPAPPPKPPDQLLATHALPWPLLQQLQALDTRLDMRIGTLVTRSGTELAGWQGQALIGEKDIRLTDTRFRLFNGEGHANLRLEPARRQAQLQLRLERVLLQEWSRRSQRQAGMLSQGPMNLVADVRASGNSWKELGATLTGPVSISVGEMTIRSRKAQEAEALLVDLLPALSEKNSEEVRLTCLQAFLPFSNGQAGSGQAIGVRSEASKLLLGGVVDLRSQQLDLRGRVRARSGVSLGMAAITGDVRIAGRMAEPSLSLEPVGALARLGAAIATTGLSILATAAYDAATSDEDPCATVRNAEAGARKSRAAVPAPTPAVKPPRAAPRKPDTR